MFFNLKVSSGGVTFPFMPAFYVLTSEIHLSSVVPTSMLRISASDRIMKQLKVGKLLSKYNYLRIIKLNFSENQEDINFRNEYLTNPCFVIFRYHPMNPPF